MKKDVAGLAERFIQDQIAIMKKHGSEPHIDSERYQATLKETRRTFEGMSTVRRSGDGPKTRHRTS